MDSELMLERTRFDDMKSRLKEEFYKAINKNAKMKDTFERNLRNFSYDDPQSYIDILISSKLSGAAENMLEGIKRSLTKPYFARIDFSEGDKEIYYIGKMSLMDEDKNVLIVDWRAPISNLYYEGRLGEASYSCPDGVIKGELSLKRQFTIEEDCVKAYFDIDQATTDEFLQGFLGANADNRLKDIVSSIQIEQNQIIRSDMWKPLIVQGAAGSGKTTIALHRIAYLIYNYKERFKSENFMILAPSNLFLNYISDILPELGVDMVRQTTFEGFAKEVLGIKIEIIDSDIRLMQFVNNDSILNLCDDKAYNISRLKSSKDFMEFLSRLAKRIEKDYVIIESVMVEGLEVISKEELERLYFEEYSYLPFDKRIKELEKHIKGRLKFLKDSIESRIERLFEDRLTEARGIMEEEERRSALRTILEERDKRILAISNHKAIISNSIRKSKNLNALEHYLVALKDEDGIERLWEGLDTRGVLPEYIEELRGNINIKRIEIDDLSPLLYLHYKIYGLKDKMDIRHIVIDEAQDFSPLQLLVLKNICKESSYTMLGDLAQGIHSHRGTRDWEDVLEVFDGNAELMYLEKSYRTTVEIMSFANGVLDRSDIKVKRGVPVVRHGDAPILKTYNDEKDIIEAIERMQSKGYKSIALIAKTKANAKEYKTKLDKMGLEINLISQKDKEYKGGLVVVPSYLAKGLEFDGVIVLDCDSKSYGKNDLDAKLLYVACTRALHELTLMYRGEISPLVADINQS